MSPVFLFAAALVLGGAFGWLLARVMAPKGGLDAPEAAALRQRLAAAEQEAAASRAALQSRADAQALLDTVRTELAGTFRTLAVESMGQNARQLVEQQDARLSDTLRPFRDLLDTFRRQVDEKFTAEVADRNSLKGELAQMLRLNQTLSQQTQALTTALTSQTKQQGIFGETVLETLLTNAGLLEGEHFYRQFAARNEEGARIIPDIVLKCPGDACVVIDSKVSLTAYVRYCDAPAGENAGLAADVWRSFKSHVDGLAAKKYESLPGAADFVLLFTPLESALAVACAHDADLRHYAFRKKVFFVTPANLLLVVKLIADLWQRDRVNRDAEGMADTARRLYEKACGFLEAFGDVGASLDRAKGDWETAKTRLQGHGGMLSFGQRLETALGSRTAKKLPAGWKLEGVPSDATPASVMDASAQAGA